MMTETLKSNDRQRVELQSSIAMTLVMIMVGMLFATLFLGYAFYRLNSIVWPPMGMEKVSLFWPTISSALVLFSSFAFEYFKKNKVSIWMYFSTLLGFLFCLSQVFLWQAMKAVGLYSQAGIFPSLIYAFSWIHLAHMLIGVLLLSYLSVKIANKHIYNNASLSMKNIGKIWHFLGAIWLIIYLTVFVL